MTKAKTKGEKRRFRKLAMPNLTPTPRRKKRGRARMDEIQTEPDAQMTVLTARARLSGMSPKDITEMRDPAYGEAAGMAIYVSRVPEVAKKLWAVYTAFTAAERMYLKLCLGLRLHAGTVKLEMMPEILEVRPDDKPDLRSDEERVRDAASAWSLWQGRFFRLADYQQDAISDVVYGRVEPMDAGKITDSGRRFVVAMEQFAEVVDCDTGTS